MVKLITETTKVRLNRLYYGDKLLELKNIDKIELDYKREKADTDRKKSEIMVDLIDTIPCMFTHEELFGKDLYATIKTTMAMDPDFFVYAFIYGDYEMLPFKLGEKEFSNAFMYIGKGNLGRIIGHGTTKKELTVPTTRLKEYNGDFRQDGKEPLLFILGKQLDETRAKWLEADMIRFVQNATHFTRGIEQLRMAPPLLNQRCEKNHEDRLLDIKGNFIHPKS